jgi:hypothetical protein
MQIRWTRFRLSPRCSVSGPRRRSNTGYWGPGVKYRGGGYALDKGEALEYAILATLRGSGYRGIGARVSGTGAGGTHLTRGRHWNMLF